MTPTTRRPRLYRALVVLSLLFFATLYMRSIRLNLPYRYTVDEDYFYVSAMNIRNTGQQYNMLYPPLSSYLTALISIGMDAASGNTQYAGAAATSAPTYLAGRLSSAFFTVLCCAVMYVIGKRLHSPAAGLVMLWLFGSDLGVFGFSLQILGDAAAYLFMAISVYFALRGLQQPHNTGARWLSTIALIIGILGKYTIAPIGVFAGYLWLRRFIPSARRQAIVIGALIGMGILALIGIRTIGQPYKTAFEHAGFLFLFSAQIINPANLLSSLSALSDALSPVFLVTSVLLLAYALSRWRVFTAVQRGAYSLALIMVSSLLVIMSMTTMRYRDLFVLPFAMYIGWGFALAFLLSGGGRAGRIALLLAGLIIAAPAYTNDWYQSNLLRSGDTRLAASHWLETHVHRPSQLVKVYTVADYLPHINGYQGGYLGWTVVPSILDNTADQWWNKGIEYAITDARQPVDNWFDLATDRKRYTGFTLAYQTPADFSGLGPQVAIFYTFVIHHPVDVYWGNLAQIFGYNVDVQSVCAGFPLRLRDFIRPLHTTEIYYQTEISLIDPATGQAVYIQRQAPDLDQRPTNFWEQYELVFDDHALNIPVGLHSGRYELRLSLYEPYHRTEMTIFDAHQKPLGNSLSLGSIQVSSCAAF